MMNNVAKAVMKRGFGDEATAMVAARCGRAFDASNTPEQEEFLGAIMFDVVVEQELHEPGLPADRKDSSPLFLRQKSRVLAERRKNVARMRKAGITFVQIGQVLGCGADTARTDWRQMLHDGLVSE